MYSLCCETIARSSDAHRNMSREPCVSCVILFKSYMLDRVIYRFYGCILELSMIVRDFYTI